MKNSFTGRPSADVLFLGEAESMFFAVTVGIAMTHLSSIALTLLLSATAGEATNVALAPSSETASTPQAGAMKLSITVNHKVVSATLNSTKTAREFATLLPLTFTMKDLFQREKYAHLPTALSENAPHTSRYEVGDISYWSPSRDVAIYYRQDGETIPPPGVITIGRLDEGAKLLDVPGSVTVRIEAAK